MAYQAHKAVRTDGTTSDLCHERLIATLTSVTPTLDVVLCAPITSANPSVSTLMDIAAQT
ncbi:hypothetical protein CFR80_17935 [Komagataeibacter oboediens]|uniref:Uncharacterized protein n=1 Tax=Komagataeibacter oboediens TaxID=65958 RepID=A0A318QJ82_9PROT|nr:hypothetical protein CFR80_17935 [Komagataeibacter oboediens]